METRLLIGGELVAGDGAPLDVEDPAREETSPPSAPPRPSRSTPRSPRRARPRRLGRDARRRARRAAARDRRAAARAHRRARRAHDPRGRQAARREPRRGGVDRERVRVLRRGRARVGRPRHPAGRGHAARDGRQGAARRRRVHRAVELPAAPARLEARARAGGGQHASASRRSSRRCRRSRSRRARPPAARRGQPGRGRGRGGRAARRRPARRRDRVHRQRRDRHADRRARRAPRRPREPRARRQGPVHRLRRRRAEIEIAARGGAWAAFLNAGQVCTSAERFYVERSVFEPFVEAFVEHTRSLRVGDPMDPSTDVGPMVSAAQRAKAVAHVEGAVARGAEMLVGGEGRDTRALLRAGGRSPARPPRPTCCARRRSGRSRRSCRSTRSTRRSRWRTTSPYGLGANVYTRDLATAVRCMRELRAGTVWINDPLTDNDAGPFGGMKRSGLGRELGGRGARGVPGDQARPHRDAPGGQGLVVPVRAAGGAVAVRVREPFIACQPP